MCYTEAACIGSEFSITTGIVSRSGTLLGGAKFRVPLVDMWPLWGLRCALLFAFCSLPFEDCLGSWEKCSRCLGFEKAGREQPPALGPSPQQGKGPLLGRHSGVWGCHMKAVWLWCNHVPSGEPVFLSVRQCCRMTVPADCLVPSKPQSVVSAVVYHHDSSRDAGLLGMCLLLLISL